MAKLIGIFDFVFGSPVDLVLFDCSFDFAEGVVLMFEFLFDGIEEVVVMLGCEYLSLLWRLGLRISAS